MEGGRTIDELELSQVMGMCSVVEYDGMLDANTARALSAEKKKRYFSKEIVVYFMRKRHRYLPTRESNF